MTTRPDPEGRQQPNQTATSASGSLSRRNLGKVVAAGVAAKAAEVSTRRESNIRLIVPGTTDSPPQFTTGSGKCPPGPSVTVPRLR